METKNTNGSDAGKIPELSFQTEHFGKARVIVANYQKGGGIAVELEDEHGESITVLSVNLPEYAHELREGEFFVKTWSENEELADEALASGVFRHTGRNGGGVLNAPIWAFN